MPLPLPVVRRLWRGRYVIAYVALATSLLAHVRFFYHPDTGFSSLIWFGERFAATRIGALAEVPIETYAGFGYDGQFYAQIAVAGNPFDPALRAALDTPAWRTRRILVPLTAHALGWGDPRRVLNVYAFLNIGVWLLLAFLLARWWFPPTDLHNLVRWGGTLFGVGMMISLARSLVDAPALLLIAGGVRAVERNRRVLGAVLLGAAGLTREPSVLAAPVLLPLGEQGGARAWLRAAAAIAICVLPAAVWILVLRAHFGYLGGEATIGAPLTGFVSKLRELRAGWLAGGFGRIHHEIWAVISLATQVGFLLSRPRLAEPWGRIGATFALLALILGAQVWEGNLSGPTRILLPMTLAFNVLVPRSRIGMVLLLLGNLTVLSAPVAFRPLPRSSDLFAGGIGVTYTTGWHEGEADAGHSWRWAAGAATLSLRNATASARAVTIELTLASPTERTVVIHVGDLEQSVPLRAQQPTPVRLTPVVLPPGATTAQFTTDAAPWPEPGGGRRQLAFSVHDLSVR